MEVPKPFKCSVCSSRFTNDDHLQVHKRRHEMSLNLKSGGLTAQALESFVEETPSPTRFFRNCEEVGLFQDLQNVNPFDEQFSKATSATPSTENFEFNFSVATPATTIPSLPMSMRRSAEQDTLNTPQVVGYPLISSTTNTSTSIITSVSNSASLSLSTPQVISTSPKAPHSSATLFEKSVTKSNETSNTSICQSPPCKEHVQNPGISTTTPRRQSVAPEFTDETNKFPGEKSPKSEMHHDPGLKSDEQVNNSRLRSSTSGKSKSRSKSNLRLNLVPQCDISDAEASAGVSTSSSNSTTSVKSALPLESTPFVREMEGPSKKSTNKDTNDNNEEHKKIDLLERNRAAASRSRERRKQWVSGLEAKNDALMAALVKARNEMKRLLTENQVLRDHLARHATCDLTKAETKTQQPHILRQNTNIIMNPTSSVFPTQFVETVDDTEIHLEAPPTQKRQTKRGRPRKGQEKRAEIVCVPASVSSSCEIPVKVQILPLSHPAASQTAKRQQKN